MRMLAMAALGLAMTAPATAANPEDKALNAVYSDLAAARAAHDVPGMAKYFAPGGILIDARPRPALGGAELADQMKPMAQRAVADKLSIESKYRVERRSVMGGIAIDAGYMRQSVARPGAEPMVRYARYLVTMRREADGGWRIVADAAMTSSREAWDKLTPVEGLKHDS